jgi:CRISPR-associated protein Cas2
MIVISLTDCPPKLRGDLSKWLLEINTGVYVGNVSTRVREELWERICENVKSGRATMVYSAAGEQKMDFCVHNSTWQPVDYDGLKLIRRPLPKSNSSVITECPSKAAQRQIGKHVAASKARKALAADYVVADIETTGLKAGEDVMLELAAIRVQNGTAVDRFQRLIKIERSIPEEVVQLTGITEELCSKEGVSLKETLREFTEFVQKDRIVCHNAAFDSKFLRAAYRSCEMSPLTNDFTDTLAMARRKVDDVSNYQLETLAAYFHLECSGLHRALPDCELTVQLFEQLKKL